MATKYRLAGLILLIMFSFGSEAQQSLSQRVSQQLTQSAAEQLDADLYVGELSVNGLTEELSAADVRLATRVEALSDPLNQLVLADRVRLTGDWQVLGQRKVTIEQLTLSGAQLTIAYYATGESNLHLLLNRLKDLQTVRYQPASGGESVIWKLQQLHFTDVTINVFDHGEPIASVHVPELLIDDIGSRNSSDSEIKSLLFPVIEQLLKQWREGSDSVQADGPALTRFLMREALAF